jgi:transposase
MEVIHARCAGIDVSKKDAKVCVRVQGRGRTPTSSTVSTWTSMTPSIMALREHLIAEKVTCVVIESTAAYWKPFYFLLDGALKVVLVNARHVRNVPGRKTDVSDAAWLAELGAHGLVRASFVPPEPVRRLRDLTRARTTWRTPGSNCPRWPVRSPGSRDGRCLKSSSPASATQRSWPTWPKPSYAARSPP